MPICGLPLCVILLFCIVTLQATQAPADTVYKAPGTYKLLTKHKSEVKIPFTMLRGKPVMECKINGKQAFLMIDNGRRWDEVWLFGTPLVEKLALPAMEGVGEIGGTGAGDPTQATLAGDLTISFDNIEFYDQSAVISPASAGYAEMFPGTDGQLCNTFFSHFVVEFDFEAKVIILHTPEDFKYTGTGCAVDMKLESSGAYSIPCAFTLEDGSAYHGRADIDLGGIQLLLIGLNNANKIELPAGAKAGKSYGAQGECTDYRATIKDMTIGCFTIAAPEVDFSDAELSRVHQDNLGIVGLPFFMKYNTIFDYGNNLLYLTGKK